MALVLVLVDHSNQVVGISCLACLWMLIIIFLLDGFRCVLLIHFIRELTEQSRFNLRVESRKVRAPQGRTPDNVWAARADG